MSEAAKSLSQSAGPLWDLGQRWAQHLARGLSALLHNPVDAQLKLWRLIPAEQTHNWCDPASRFDLLACQDGDLPPLAGTQLEISLPLADAMIDLLLGSQAHPQAKPRQILTALDRLLLKQPLIQCCNDFNAAIGPQAPYHLKPAATPQSTGSGELTLCELTLRLGECTGEIRLALPCNQLESLLPALEGDRPAQVDAFWPAVTIDADQINNLAHGDLLTTDLPTDSEIILHVNGQGLFAAQLGQYQGRRALTITRKISTP